MSRACVRGILAALGALLVCATAGADAAPPAAAAAPTAHVSKDSPALFGMGAQACRAFLDVAAEKTGREIAISGAMFSWAQGWFSARNVIGHENAPRAVGGTLSAERLKSMLIQECSANPDDTIYLATDELYDELAHKGL